MLFSPLYPKEQRLIISLVYGRLDVFSLKTEFINSALIYCCVPRKCCWLNLNYSSFDIFLIKWVKHCLNIKYFLLIHLNHELEALLFDLLFYWLWKKRSMMASIQFLLCIHTQNFHWIDHSWSFVTCLKRHKSGGRNSNVIRNFANNIAT